MTVEEVEVNVRQIDEDGPEEPSPLAALLRRLILAGVGVVALTYDETEKQINRLVERGELAQQEAEKLLHEMTEGIRQQQEAAAAPAENIGESVGASFDVDSGLEKMLNSLNIPSKRDINELSAKIAQLAARVEQLHQGDAPSGGTAKGGSTGSGKKNAS
jgi:poly(hydroxyalkanoate) granule-associated protein